MNIRKLVLVILCLTFSVSLLYAIQGVVATEDDVFRLRKALRNGEIQVGKTRLMEIREKYGDATSISDTERKLVYTYHDVKISFDKKKFWQGWEYDSFKKAAYSDDIDDLRYDLESEELVGNNITFLKIRKEYDEPTESFETHGDGEISVYYYGNIKMIFENYITVRSWKGSNLEKIVDEGVLKTKIKEKEEGK